MTDPVLVRDPSDPRLADYVSLTDVHLRRNLETAEGLFIAEGETVIRRAIATGFAVRSLLVASDKLATIAEVAASCPAPCYVLPAAVPDALGLAGKGRVATHRREYRVRATADPGGARTGCLGRAGAHPGIHRRCPSARQRPSQARAADTPRAELDRRPDSER